MGKISNLAVTQTSFDAALAQSDYLQSLVDGTVSSAARISI